MQLHVQVCWRWRQSETLGKRSTKSRHLRVHKCEPDVVSQMWWFTPGNPGTWHKDQEFKACLGYTVSLKVGWDMRLSQKGKTKIIHVMA